MFGITSHAAVQHSMKDGKQILNAAQKASAWPLRRALRTASVY
jgi:hypothetical protein